MKTRLVTGLILILCSLSSNAVACSVCYSAHPPKSMESMAVAIWFLMGALMSVLGGFGALGFHLWKHSRMALEPHQELVEEDFEKYE